CPWKQTCRAHRRHFQPGTFFQYRPEPGGRRRRDLSYLAGHAASNPCRDHRCRISCTQHSRDTLCGSRHPAPLPATRVIPSQPRQSSCLMTSASPCLRGELCAVPVKIRGKNLSFSQRDISCSGNISELSSHLQSSTSPKPDPLDGQNRDR